MPRVAAAECSRAVHSRGPNALNNADWIQCTSGGLTRRGSPPKCGTTRSPERKHLHGGTGEPALVGIEQRDRYRAFKSSSSAAPANTIQKA